MDMEKGNGNTQYYLALINSTFKYIVGSIFYIFYVFFKNLRGSNTNEKINDKRNLSTQLMIRGALGFVANKFNISSSLREELKGTQGWINATIGLKSDDINSGRITIEDCIPNDANVIVISRTENDLLEQLQSSPEEGYKMILCGRIRVEGNMLYMGLWDQHFQGVKKWCR